MLQFESCYTNIFILCRNKRTSNLILTDFGFKINYEFSLNVHIVAERCLGEIEKLFDPVDLMSVR